MFGNASDPGPERRHVGFLIVLNIEIVSVYVFVPCVCVANCHVAAAAGLGFGDCAWLFFWLSLVSWLARETGQGGSWRGVTMQSMSCARRLRRNCKLH